MTGAAPAISSFLLTRPHASVVAITHWGYRVVAICVTLLTTRWLLRGLGQDLFAVFAVLTGLIPFFALLNLGLGGTLQNIISRSRAVSVSYDRPLALGIGLLCAAFVVFNVAMIPLSAVLAPLCLGSLPRTPGPSAAALFYLFGLLFSLTTIATISQKIYYAESRGHVANLVMVGGSIASMASVHIAFNLCGGSNLPLAGVTLYGPVIALLGLLLFRVCQVHRIPAVLRTVKVAEASALLRDGTRFMGVTAMMLLATKVDYIIIAHTCTSGDVVVYKLLNSIFAAVFGFHASYVAAMWPELSASMSLGQGREAVKRVLRVSLTGTLTVVLIGAILWALRSPVASFFGGTQTIVFPASTVILFVLVTMLKTWCEGFFVLLLATGRLRIFFYVLPIQILIATPMMLVLGREYGLNGVLLGIAIPTLVTQAWAFPLALRKLSQKS